MAPEHFDDPASPAVFRRGRRDPPRQSNSRGKRRTLGTRRSLSGRCTHRLGRGVSGPHTWDSSRSPRQLFSLPARLVHSNGRKGPPVDNGAVLQPTPYPAAPKPIRLRRPSMKRQILLTSAVTAVFILAAASASLAADRRWHHRDFRSGFGRHFAATPHSGHWNRFPATGPSHGWRNGRHFTPRHRLQHRPPNHRPRFRTPRRPYGQHPGYHRGWRDRSPNPYRPDHSRQRPSAGYDRTGRNFSGRDRSDHRQTEGAVASHNGASHRDGRRSGGRQGPF